jgi:glycosyltransferase involved in cell wall biosynthesis
VAGLLAGLLCIRRRFDLIQVHTVPDVLVFAALIPRLLGVPVLLDLHEVMPEMFSTTFGVEENHWTCRAIVRCEQASIRFADFALTCTEDMRRAFIKRGASPQKIAVVMNSADESVFQPSGARAHQQNDAFTLLHHGTMEPRYGIDTVIRAVAAARAFVPQLRLLLYGDGTQRRDLIELTCDLGVDDVVWFSDGFVPTEDLIAGIVSCDAGVVAMRRDAFRDLTHCNKMFDLISMRRPVICSRTGSVMSYFPEDCFEYFESGDHEDLARAIRTLHEHPQRRETMVRRAAEVNQPYRWPHQRRRYLDIVEAVASSRAV